MHGRDDARRAARRHRRGRRRRRTQGQAPAAGELDHLLDIHASPASFTTIDIGDRVVLSCDGGGSKMTGAGVQDLLESEQRLDQDILELRHLEYSYKAIKTMAGL